MIDMFLNSLRLFLRGKLFREPRAVLRQWLIGFALSLLAVLLLGALGLPIWLVVLCSALAAGALQPWLFRDLKYA